MSEGWWGKDAEGTLNYNKYLKVPQLISLQHCLSTPPHHDEMLFIIIHQVYELWFRLILHECDSAIAAMQSDDVLRAERQLGRVGEIQRILVQQIHILETMLPVDFLGFRDRLKPASGFQSGQFREIEFVSGLKDENVLIYFKNEPDVMERLKQRLASPSLADAFYALLIRNGMDVPERPSGNDQNSWDVWRDKTSAALAKLYKAPAENYDIYRLAERLIEFDEYITLWRFHHIRMVERMIGFKQGTGGSEGVGYLQKTLSQKSFPELWQARTLLDIA